MKELRVTGRILPISEATKRRNPELYGHQNPPLVAGLPATKSEQNPIPALDQGKKAKSRRRSRVVLRVELVRCGTRLLDDDNLTACFKGLRDSIAATLNIDDSDSRVEWRYSQIESPRGCTGTIVRFDTFSAQP